MIRYFACAFTVVALLGAPAGAVVTIGGATVPKDPNNALYAQISALNLTMYADPMIGSLTETFAFESVDHLKTHCQIRGQTISVIGWMKEGGPIDFDYGEYYADLTLMKSLDPTPGVQSPWFKAKKSTTKTSDIADAVTFGKTRSDCRAAAVCAVLLGHWPIVGSAVIDAQIPPGTFRSSRFYLVQDATDTKTVIPGDVVYMKNDDYKTNAPAYQDWLSKHGLPAKTADELLWNGEWTICVGANSYKGLGLPAMNEVDLRAELYLNLNEDANITLNPQQRNDQIIFLTPKRIMILPP